MGHGTVVAASAVVVAVAAAVEVAAVTGVAAVDTALEPCWVPVPLTEQ